MAYYSFPPSPGMIGALVSSLAISFYNKDDLTHTGLQAAGKVLIEGYGINYVLTRFAGFTSIPMYYGGFLLLSFLLSYVINWSQIMIFPLGILSFGLGL
jgi:hypothetical protein